MATINLRDFYPWYTHDELVDVPDVVAAELMADRRYQKAHGQRIRRNKSFYSLDAEDGIEASALVYEDMSPDAIVEMAEWHCRLCRALNSLPEVQGRRIEEHYILGMSQKEIAKAENVTKGSVSLSIKKGLVAMKKYLNNHR